MISIGEISLWAALLLAAWTGVVSLLGAARNRGDLLESGRRAVLVIAVLTLVAAAALWTALFSHDLSLAAVASHTTRNLPKLYVFSAFWQGRPGGLLFAALCLAWVSSLAVLTGRDHHAAGRLSGMIGVLLLLVLAACIASNPFARLGWVPVEGVGLDTRAQSPLAVLHAPALYAAYAVFAVSIAATLAAVSVTGRSVRLGDRLRRWLAVAWALSAAAILTGLAWAYMEPAMIESWRLQPVRDGSLFIWIVLSLVLTLELRRENHNAPAHGYKLRRLRWAVVAMSALITAVGLGGTALRQGTTATLATAGTTMITDVFGDRWVVTSQGFSRYTVLNRNVTAVALDVELNGKRKGLVTPEIREYFDGRGASLPRLASEPGVESSWKGDFYVFLTSLSDTGEAGLRLSLSPFASWIWAGGALLVLSGLWLFWPYREERAS